MSNPILLIATLLSMSYSGVSQSVPYPIVDTDVEDFSDYTEIIKPPGEGDPFYGQDATYHGNEPSYTDHGDGTITDLVTGLTWEKEMGEKISWTEAFIKSDTMKLGGFDDWRVPTIKELYSLILFTGRVQGATAIKKFIDTTHFNQPLGDKDLGEREIDAQTWSSTQYVGLTMKGDTTVFGVNFIDGRIKGYPKYQPGSNNTIPRSMYFRMVRGNPSYGTNDYKDQGDGTITDYSTGLMWQQSDDGVMRDWEEALRYAENLELAGYDDWRLPNAKELQSIVDYTRSPQATGSAAIDPVFHTTEIDDPDGNPGQFPYFWTGTTHQDGPDPYASAVYIAFGEAQGKMNGNLMDVHGAGAQRSDPKTGDISTLPQYHGPQGDVRYVYNAVRCVREFTQQTSVGGGTGKNSSLHSFPNPAEAYLTIHADDRLEHRVGMYNTFGQQLGTWYMLGSKTIDINNLGPGIYLIIVDGSITGKFIKN